MSVVLQSPSATARAISSDPKTAENERPQIVTSEELLRGQRELWIEHGENMYRLRLTSAGKLYLTK